MQYIGTLSNINENIKPTLLYFNNQNHPLNGQLSWPIHEISSGKGQRLHHILPSSTAKRSPQFYYSSTVYIYGTEGRTNMYTIMYKLRGTTQAIKEYEKHIQHSLVVWILRLLWLLQLNIMLSGSLAVFLCPTSSIYKQ